MHEDEESKPQIPMSHFLSELKKAMFALNELFDASAPKESILERLKNEAKQRRPWLYIEFAFKNHDNDLQWLQNWCKNSQSLL